MRIVGLAIIACLLCALKTNAYSADLDPDTLSVGAGYGRIVLPGTQVHLNATLANGPGARVMWRQVQGTAVAMSSTNALQTTVSIPVDVNSAETLLFEVRAEMESGQQASDIVWIEVYVPQQNPADLTLVADFSPKVGWECNQDPVEVPEVQTRVLENTIEYTTNGIPAHATGQFPNRGNPNMIWPVTQTWRIPRNPEKTDTPTEMAVFGITLEGIKLERDTAESYRNQRQWNYEALTPGIARRLRGIYHYYLTDDYPYMPRCVWGTPDPSFRQRRAGGGPPGGRRFRRPPPRRR